MIQTPTFYHPGNLSRGRKSKFRLTVHTEFQTFWS